MAKTSLEFSEDKKAGLRLREQLRVFSFTSKEKKIFINKMGTSVRKDSRRRIKDQRTLDGQSMEPRKQRKNLWKKTKKKGRNRKMLRGLARLMSIDASTNGTGRVGWKNSVTGKIARLHQDGGVEQSGRIKASREEDYVSRSDWCPRSLAKELIALGYRHGEQDRRTKKIKYRRVSVKWICANMKRRKASAALYMLQNREPHMRWDINVPARPFLGTSKANTEELTTEIARQMLHELHLA
ncbi:MAG: phage virion morphogenesis protein [Desulfovibrio sp.]|uniref:phage virion morphogenesis protein n=1 Tax=Desulfovibrio sp. 7SRBS1 TaxID=3378064 RepID=UPI003B406161